MLLVHAARAYMWTERETAKSPFDQRSNLYFLPFRSPRSAIVTAHSIFVPLRSDFRSAHAPETEEKIYPQPIAAYGYIDTPACGKDDQRRKRP